jgi:phosphoglycolate phosphatase-like HAD superfamily hydrolase
MVTMQGRSACDAVVGRFTPPGLFRRVVTREDSLDRAEQIGIAVRSLGSAPGRTLFVGDRLNDVVAARKAGVEVAVVGRTLSGPTQPDHSFPTMGDLESFLTST